MSKTSARHQALQEFLSARGYATIEELARHFEVTPQTVRKDINALFTDGPIDKKWADLIHEHGVELFMV